MADVELGYEELVEQIKNAPLTWLPALLITVVQAAWHKRVFVEGGAVNIVVQTENKLRQGEEV